LGLRWEFLDEFLERRPTNVDVLEVCPENYMRRGGAIPAALSRVRETHPVLTHGLTMSLGGTEPFEDGYMTELRDFIASVESPWHSDHLCFGVVGGRVLHDLLPLAFTEEAVRRVADRVRRAQDMLGVRVAVENISFYVHPGVREMTEPEFLTRVCELADCRLMLDVNNAWVNAQNFGFDVDEWMAKAPLERTVQIHVAGHQIFDEPDFVPGSKGGTIILDTHGAPVADPVMALLGRVLPKTGPVPVILERDTNIPSLDALLAEVDALRAVYDRAIP
jgi:hypothetical protein